MSISSPHQALRAATADSHVRLDLLFGQFNLGESGSYAGFLRAHAAAVLVVEAALDQAEIGLQLPDWDDRRRSPAILADLLQLRTAPPIPLAFPMLAGVGAAWGAAYVLEGSRLGGTVLSRQLAPDLPRAYLAGAQSRGAWPHFLKQLDAALGSPAHLSAATAAALATFDLFERAGRQELEIDPK